jgi:hypothetical protein
MKRARILAAVLLATLLLSATRMATPVTSVLAAQAQAEKKEVEVWVNTASGVYHCPGSRWYGKTKQGEYMSECEAKKKGYRPAYHRPCGSECGK